MGVALLAIVDLGIATATAAAWFAAAALLHGGRVRAASLTTAIALLLTLLRGASVAWLAFAGGWWLVQETVLLSLPLLGLATFGAAGAAGRVLVRAARGTPDEPGRFRAVLSLFAVAFAATTGPVVTLIAGAPLALSTFVIAVSAVVGAVALTGVLIRPATPSDRPSQGLTRRRMLGATGAIATAAGITGTGLAFLPGSKVDAGGGAAGVHLPNNGIPVTDLRGPEAPAAGGTTHRHTVTARTATVALTSGHEVDAWTYEGTLPGPLIEAVQGDLIEVTLRNNNIDDGLTMHWHGYDLPCGEDGAPGASQESVMPGEEFTYRFRADQRGTYWYHTHQTSHIGVRRGLYGCLVVRDPTPGEPLAQDFIVAVHTFDGRVVIGDSDEVVEKTAEPQTPVRLRLINTDSDPRWFSLLGTPFRVVAVDGRDLNEPDEIEEYGLRLPAGGRYDVTFTMPERPVALLIDHDPGGGLRVRPGDAISDEIPDGAEETRSWPELDFFDYGRPSELPFDPEGPFDREFDMVLDRGLARVSGVPAYAQTVNGYAFPTIPTQLVDVGDLVLLTVVNRSFEPHPWHLHGHTVHVLQRDGRAPSGSPIPHDTFDVLPGEVWVVGFRAANPGLWMNHCHDLRHAHDGMMLRLDYTGISSPFDEEHQHAH